MTGPETHVAFELLPEYAEAEGFSGSLAYGPDGATLHILEAFDRKRITLGGTRKIDGDGLPVVHEEADEDAGIRVGDPVMVDHVVELGPQGVLVTDDAALISALDHYPAVRRVDVPAQAAFNIERATLPHLQERVTELGLQDKVVGTGAEGAVTRADLQKALREA